MRRAVRLNSSSERLHVGWTLSVQCVKPTVEDSQVASFFLPTQEGVYSSRYRTAEELCCRADPLASLASDLHTDGGKTKFNALV